MEKSQADTGSEPPVEGGSECVPSFVHVNGAAIAIEEYVPTTRPASKVKQKARMPDPPSKNRISTENRVVPEVSRVRLRV